jgi:hypothetical protein
LFASPDIPLVSCLLLGPAVDISAVASVSYVAAANAVDDVPIISGVTAVVFYNPSGFVLSKNVVINVI